VQIASQMGQPNPKRSF